MNARFNGRMVGPASWLVVAFGFLMLVNGGVAVARGTATTGDVLLTGLLLAAAVTTALGLRRRARWAWWTALVLGSIGLFFILPVAGTILLGGSLEPVGTGWDVVFFPMTAGVLVALLTLLWTLRKTAVAGEGSPPDGS
jgi:hypothetical protein